MRASRVRANGLEFGVLAAGSGPLALCLHGFPDAAHTWEHLLPALAGAGFRAVAPFMRGYAPTAVLADGADSPSTPQAAQDTTRQAAGPAPPPTLYLHGPTTAASQPGWPAAPRRCSPRRPE